VEFIDVVEQVVGVVLKEVRILVYVIHDDLIKIAQKWTSIDLQEVKVVLILEHFLPVLLVFELR
jgi:hypothetical protein